MDLQATYLGANGWLLEFPSPSSAPLRVLVDPWLEGDLVFPPGPWFLRGELPRPQPLPDGVDLLLLTQGLADHCHPPTLSRLPRDLAVVASPTAAVQVKRLGFSAVTSLAPGEHHSIGRLTITATAGAAVPQIENGYLLDHPAGRIYLEPHGYLDSRLEARQVDAVITPVVDLGLPLAGAFIRGREVLPRLVERLSPLTILASTTGGDVRLTGLLSGWVWQKGSVAEACGQTGSCELVDPVPGTVLQLPTRSGETGSLT